MTKHWTSYLLIILIACQSVFAFADNHEVQDASPLAVFDQSDIVQNELIVNQLNTKDATNIDNCDHCGFCHHGQLVPVLLSFSSAPSTVLLKTQYNMAIPNDPLFSFYRPPKV